MLLCFKNMLTCNFRWVIFFNVCSIHSYIPYICKCCKKHKFNFPTLECELPTLDKPEEYNTWGCDCDCPCRHIARHLCREWDLINEVDVINTDSEVEDSEESEVNSDDSINDFIVSDDEGEYKFTKEARDELRKIVDLFRGKHKK